MLTRMHASRMRTVRCSDRLGGWGAWGVSAQGGFPRGVSAWGCTPPPMNRLRLRTVKMNNKNRNVPQPHGWK